MSHQTFTVTDPRNFDGDPFDVAVRGVAQLKGVLDIASSLTHATMMMARNAEMERNMLNGEAAGVARWDDSAQGKQWAQIESELSGLIKRAQTLQRAAGFDPRKAR